MMLKWSVSVYSLAIPLLSTCIICVCASLYVTSETWKHFCADKNIFIYKITMQGNWMHSNGKDFHLLLHTQLLRQMEEFVGYCLYVNSLVPTSWSCHMWTTSILQAQTPSISLYLVVDLLSWLLQEVAVLFKFSILQITLWRLDYDFFSKHEISSYDRPLLRGD